MIVRIVIALICSLIWVVWEYKNEKKDIKTKGATLADKFEGKEKKPELSRYILATSTRAISFYVLITFIDYFLLQESII